MKELRFETSKGEFVLVDIPEKLFLIGQYYVDTYGPEHYNLKEITEEQAGGIVDKVMNGQHFQNYNYKSVTDRWCKNAIESLHSLLESKGVHLFENPIDLEESLECNCDICYGRLESDHEEAEEKTIKNPYIFVLKWKEKSI